MAKSNYIFKRRTQKEHQTMFSTLWTNEEHPFWHKTFASPFVHRRDQGCDQRKSETCTPGQAPLSPHLPYSDGAWQLSLAHQIAHPNPSSITFTASNIHLHNRLHISNHPQCLDEGNQRLPSKKPAR